jgi:hypothetical protein
MEPVADFIIAFAALLSAIAWPIAFLIVAFAFRTEVKGVFARMRKGKVGNLLDFELDKVAAATTLKISGGGGDVTVEQAHSSARIEARSGDIGQSELLKEMERLSIEYETIRASMASSRIRTEAMTRVVAQMRAVGPALASKVDTFKMSASPGRRLAAIAIMQMQPSKADLDWLSTRTDQEVPFVFYHAALALRNAWRAADEPGKLKAREAATEALSRLKSFTGTPDRNTMTVLQSILAN